MATYNKFNRFSRDILEAKHNFVSDVFRAMLTNSAPVATNSVKADLTEIADGGGYSSGGPLLNTVSVTSVGGLTRVSSTPVVITSSGLIGPFRYAVLYNSTSGTQPLISWWDYGASITLQNTETFTISFDAINGILDIQ